MHVAGEDLVERGEEGLAGRAAQSALEGLVQLAEGYGGPFCGWPSQP